MSKKNSKLKVVPAKAVSSKKEQPLSKKELLEVYSTMLNLRRFQEKVASIYQQGLIGGFCHLYIGQEAVVMGSKMACNEGDDIITSYRCHAHTHVFGKASFGEILAELTGKETGISKGKGGSMHMFSPENRFWGGHGIVSAQSALGAGLAFAAKYRKEDRVCLTYMGDGATNAGQFFESMNMAALWDLPVIYIVENNQYSMGTAVNRGTAGEIYKRGECFGIPGEKVDGMDFFAVYEAVKRACDYTRKNSKPYLLEMDTYRYRGHSMSDPAKYRTREELDKVKQERDPITNLATHLKENFGLSDADLKKYDEAAKKETAKAVEFAENSAEPCESELMTEIIPETEGK